MSSLVYAASAAGVSWRNSQGVLDRSVTVKEPRHQDILTMLRQRYDGPIMNNVCRGDYVECMIGFALGGDWRLTWMDGWDWAAWDCEHRRSGARLEVKQAAARQTWDKGRTRRQRTPAFDIAPRSGFWTREGVWIDSPSRLADIYVFAWHGRDDDRANHTDPGQWLFFAVAERDLPKNQKSIGLGRLKGIAAPCGVADLRIAVETVCPAERELKAAQCRRPPGHE